MVFLQKEVSEKLKAAARAVSAPRPPAFMLDRSGDTCMSAWRTVLGQLDKEPYHREFLMLCMREKRVDFAFECYKNLSELRPDDKIAKAQLERIAGLLNMQLTRADLQPPETTLVRKTLRMVLLSAIGLLAMVALYGLVGLAKDALKQRSSAAITRPGAE